MCFKRKKNNESDAEKDFRTIIGIVAKYDKQGFNRLMSAIEQCWIGYDIVLRTKTREEKENPEIVEAERKLEFIEQKEKEDGK